MLTRLIERMFSPAERVPITVPPSDWNTKQEKAKQDQLIQNVAAVALALVGLALTAAILYIAPIAGLVVAAWNMSASSAVVGLTLLPICPAGFGLAGALILKDNLVNCTSKKEIATHLDNMKLRQGSANPKIIKAFLQYKVIDQAVADKIGQMFLDYRLAATGMHEKARLLTQHFGYLPEGEVARLRKVVAKDQSRCVQLQNEWQELKSAILVSL